MKHFKKFGVAMEMCGVVDLGLAQLVGGEVQRQPNYSVPLTQTRHSSQNLPFQEDSELTLSWPRSAEVICVMEVPYATRLADIYPEGSIAGQQKRWDDLVSLFKTTYGEAPDFISRSPGRVNLIGEVSV
jgi:hypothetical protein